MDLPNLKKNEQFSQLTTLKIGGPIKLFTKINSLKELQQAISFSKEQKIKFLVIGGGSNLLVSDNGFDGLVIKNNIAGIEIKRSEQSFSPASVPEMSKAPAGTVSEDENGLRTIKLLQVHAGTILQDLVDYTISHGLTGLHKLTGIPGTVGGALFGNAGAYGQTISDHIDQVVCLNPDTLETVNLSKMECQFSYRDSGFKKNELILLEVVFKLPLSDSENLKKESAEILQKRLNKYKPGILCPGSFFKNILIENLPEQTKKLIPPERDYFGKVPAWYFLDEVGAKGDKLGNIQIADFHGNLFINLGQGTASDFYDLAKKYYLKVKVRFGIELEPEVQLINLPPFDQ